MHCIYTYVPYYFISLFHLDVAQPEEEEKLQSVAAQALVRLRKIQEKLGDKEGNLDLI